MLKVDFVCPGKSVKRANVASAVDFEEADCDALPPCRRQLAHLSRTRFIEFEKIRARLLTGAWGE